MIAQISTWILVSGAAVFAIAGLILICLVYGNIGGYSGLRNRYRRRGKKKNR